MANKGCRFPPEVLNPEELARFFGTFGKSIRDVRNKCIFLLALRAQLRCSEILALRVCDIDFVRCSITVLNGKGSKRRTVGVDPDTIRELDKHRAVWKLDSGDMVFVSHKGNPLDTSYVRKIAKRHAIIGRVSKRVHIHGFRHTGACILAEKGVGVRIISKQLGHSNISTTDRYLNHLQPNDVIDAVSAVTW